MCSDANTITSKLVTQPRFRLKARRTRESLGLILCVVSSVTLEKTAAWKQTRWFVSRYFDFSVLVRRIQGITTNLIMQAGGTSRKNVGAKYMLMQMYVGILY